MKKVVAYGRDTDNKRVKIVIQEDSAVGFYVYVYDEGDKCLYDYLQDNLSSAMSFAENKFKVDKDAWE